MTEDITVSDYLGVTDAQLSENLCNEADTFMEETGKFVLIISATAEEVQAVYMVSFFKSDLTPDDFRGLSCTRKPRAVMLPSGRTCRIFVDVWTRPDGPLH